MIKLKITRKFEIVGRGTVYTLNLKENNISPYRKGFSDLMGKEVLIENTPYVVTGIEAFGKGEDLKHENIGLLVREIQRLGFNKEDGEGIE